MAVAALHISDPHTHTHHNIYDSAWFFFLCVQHVQLLIAAGAALPSMAACLAADGAADSIRWAYKDSFRAAACAALWAYSSDCVVAEAVKSSTLE